MEISVNELSQIVLTAYDQGRRSVKDKEVKGEILTYRGISLYDTKDVVRMIIKRIEEERDNQTLFDEVFHSKKDNTIDELSKIIQSEFLIPLNYMSPKCVSAER